MSLIQCKDCGKEVSSQARRCPHCRADVQAGGIWTGGIIAFIFFILIMMYVALNGNAEEIYTWTDKKGQTHISNRPPRDPVKIVDRTAYQPDSPEEIAAFEARRKLIRQQNEIAERKSRAIEETRRAERRYDSAMSNIDAQIEQRRQKRAEARAQDAAIEKERLQAIENRDYNEARRQTIKLERTRIDRELKE